MNEQNAIHKASNDIYFANPDAAPVEEKRSWFTSAIFFRSADNSIVFEWDDFTRTLVRTIYGSRVDCRLHIEFKTVSHGFFSSVPPNLTMLLLRVVPNGTVVLKEIPLGDIDIHCAPKSYSFSVDVDQTLFTLVDGVAWKDMICRYSPC